MDSLIKDVLYSICKEYERPFEELNKTLSV